MSKSTFSRSIKILAAALALFAVLSGVFGIVEGMAYGNAKETFESELAAFNAKNGKILAEDRKALEVEESENIVFIDVANYGLIAVELYPEEAPITVANFKKLVNEDFYDGLTFHRIIENFMIQGGDPKGNGTGGSTPIKGEFALNGVSNKIQHVRGTISMARRGDSYDSGSCQFFIVHQTSANNSASLDGQYAAFGKVVVGMDVVDKLAALPTDANDKPLRSAIMRTVTQSKAELATQDAALAEKEAILAKEPKFTDHVLLTWIFLAVTVATGVAAVVVTVLYKKAEANRRAEELARAEAIRAARAAERAEKNRNKKRK